MAKLHLDRLAEKYPNALASGEVTGVNYRALMSEIIANNHGNIQRAVGRIQTDHYQQQAAKIKRSTTKQIAVPALEEVLPKRSVFLRKGAEQGQLLSDSLRDELTKNLRSAVTDYLKTGADSMQYRKGERRGRINPELVQSLKTKMTETFAGYTKPDATGVPKNIETIANTEIRSAISDIKHEYAKKLEERNPGRIQMVKIWKHNPSLSDHPRANHRFMDGKEKPIGVPFSVPLLKKSRNGWIWGGPTMMMHPHDPTAPAEQVINCSCECIYVTRVL